MSSPTRSLCRPRFFFVICIATEVRQLNWMTIGTAANSAGLRSGPDVWSASFSECVCVRGTSIQSYRSTQWFQRAPGRDGYMRELVAHWPHTTVFIYGRAITIVKYIKRNIKKCSALHYAEEQDRKNRNTLSETRTERERAKPEKWEGGLPKGNLVSC